MSEVGYSGDHRSVVQQTAKTHIMKQAKVVDKHVRARRADGRDAEVGRRVRSRRLECRLSQTELADRIGVTFQQVQKYEKGVNRIGAGRLQRISEALEVPISFFFGGPGSAAPTKELNGGAESVFGFLQTSGSVRIVKAFHKIKSRKARQLLVEMAEELADAQAA
jgi:transcriptional regulator with XRE-family HTH domain